MEKNKSKGRDLAKNTVTILIGKICTQFISFLLLPLYTAVLSSSQFGIVDLLTTYIGLLVPVITLQLESALFRHLIDCRDNELEKTKTITNVITSVVFQLVFCFIIFIIISQFIDIPYKGYLCGSVMATIFSNLFLSEARGIGDNIGYSIGSVIAGGTTVVLNVLFLVVFHMGAAGMLLSSALANTLCVFYLFFKHRIYHYIDVHKINRHEIMGMLSYSIPLVPNGIIWWIISVSDRTIITAFIGLSATGIYAVANKFSNILVNVYSVFGVSWTESASIHIEEKEIGMFFSNIMNMLLKFFSSICLGLIACLPFVFPFFINVRYMDAYYYVPILLIGSLFNILASFIGGIYVAKKLSKQIAVTSFLSGIINLIVNILLIQKIGVYAAAISTMVSVFAMFLYRYIDIQKYVKVKLERNLIPVIVLVLFISMASYYYNHFLTNCLTLILVLVYTWYMNWFFIRKFLMAGKIRVISLFRKR